MFHQDFAFALTNFFNNSHKLKTLLTDNFQIIGRASLPISQKS
jgi:hypothetical protein